MSYAMLPFLLMLVIFAILCAASILFAAADLLTQGIARRAPLPIAQALLTVAAGFLVAFAPPSLAIPALVAAAIWALLLRRPARHLAALGLVGLASLQLPARASSLALLACVAAAFAVDALWRALRVRRLERRRHRAWHVAHA